MLNFTSQMELEFSDHPVFAITADFIPCTGSESLLQLLSDHSGAHMTANVVGKQIPHRRVIELLQERKGVVDVVLGGFAVAVAAGLWSETVQSEVSSIKTLFGLSAALDFVLMGLTKGWLPTHGKHIVWYRRGFHCVAKGHRAIGKQPISFIA